MRLILFLGVVLLFTVAMAGRMYSKNVINCSSVSKNLNLYEVMPIRYDVRIAIKPRLRILSGYLNILIEVKNPTKNISLHAVSSYSYEVDGTPESASYNLLDFQYCKEKEVLILMFNRTLARGRYRFKIAYISVLNTNIQKYFYRTTWTRRNQTWLLTNFYTPNAIRALFPCWDDPRVKAIYNISMQFPADYTVLSTMPEKSPLHKQLYTLIQQFGIEMTLYENFIFMPTHLIVFLNVGDITMNSKHKDIHYIWYHTDANQKFSHVLTMAETTKSFVETFMKIKSSDFPSKINHVVLPNSPMKSMGAPGIIVYREKDITFDEYLTFAKGRSIDVMMLITYEMARQLFVGLFNWHSNDYVWLNEIFASFFGHYFTNKIWLLHRLTELFVVKFIQPALNSDTFLEREPIIHKAKNSDGIDALLYPLLYHKKAFALIRMLSILYIPETFNKAIKRYVHDRTKDVWTILEEVHSLKRESGYTVKEIMDTWFKTKHYPELFIQRDYETWSAACTLSSTFIKDNPQWIIPVNYFTENNYESYDISEVFWFRLGQKKSIYVVHKDDFLIVNAEQMGYYRVNYDRKNWLMISTYLQEKNFSHISPINRAQLINDAYYFIMRNQLESYIFINITKHMNLDTDFVAWYPIFNILSDMSFYFKFYESHSIKAHFLKILDVVSIIKYEDSPWDNTIVKPMRYLVRKWACKLGHSVCRNAAFHRLIYHLDHQDKISEMSKEWILCDGMKVEDLNAWKNILHKSIIYGKFELLQYLSCTENSTIIVHFLTLMLRTNYFLGLEESMGPICRNIVKKHVGKSTVLRFVIDNYDVIENRFPQDFPPGVLLSDIIMNVYSSEDLDMIQEYASKNSWIIHFGSKSLEVLISQWKIYLMKVWNKFEMFHG